MTETKPRRRRLPRYSRLLRWTAPLWILGWLFATGAAIKLIPPLSPTVQRSVIGAAVTKSSPAVQGALLDAQRFAFPVGSQVVVVQYDEHGLSYAAQLNTLKRAEELDQHQLPGLADIRGAIPVANDSGHVLSHGAHATTALTYLLIPPSLSFGESTLLAETYANRYLSGKGNGLIGVTGAYPAEYQQGLALTNSLPLVEWLGVAILVLVIGLTFRSVVAPALALAASGIAYVISQRLLSLATIHLGISVPSELDPIIVVLLLGLMTDYTVFYLTAFRRRLNEGGGRKVAAPLAFREVTPIVLVAGFTVAAGVALVQTAQLPLFSDLGPGLAITVGVTVLVAVTFLPATFGLLGRYSLWPKARPAKVGGTRRRFQQIVANRYFGPLFVIIVVAGLIWLSTPLGNFSLGINAIDDLAANSQPRAAATLAGKGFAPGVVAPTEVMVSGPSAHDIPKLSVLQALLAQQPGVAAALGPADDLSHSSAGVFLSKSGPPTARFLLIFRASPLDSSGIATYRQIQHAMPSLLTRSGLAGSSTYYAGDTALSSEIAAPARSDMVWVAIAVIIVDFLLLAIFLRALIAPFVLVLASTLIVSSSLGITMLLFPSTANVGFAFYTPFAAEVLLLSFGADYNLFLTGEIWRVASRRRFRVALPEGASQASAGINIAGAALALTFLVLVVVPLRSFTELGVMMFIGLLIDTFLVRFFVVPGVLGLLGPLAGWPGHRLDAVPRAAGPIDSPPRGGYGDSPPRGGYGDRGAVRSA